MKLLSYRPRMARSLMLIMSALLVAAGTLLSIGTEPANAEYGIGRCTAVEVLAHRGLAASWATENTLRAFNNAYSKGVRTMETDIRMTRDGQWVLMHDATINRTTRNSGAVANMSLAQIKNIVTNDGHRGNVPSLAEFAAWAKARPTVKLQVELKVGVSTANIKKALTILSSNGLKSRTVITSFIGTALLRAKAADPGWQQGIIISSQRSAASIRRFGNNVILNENKATFKYLRTLHRSNIRVYTWTVDSKSQWKKMVRNGANAVISNHSPSMRSYCR